MKMNEIISEKRQVLDDNRNVVVWKNPSRNEFMELVMKCGEVRGGITRDGDLYIWNAFMNTHGTISSYVSFGYPFRIYLYFSKYMPVASEWNEEMKKVGDIYVGVKLPDDYEGKKVTNPNFLRLFQ